MPMILILTLTLILILILYTDADTDTDIDSDTDTNTTDTDTDPTDISVNESCLKPETSGLDDKKLPELNIRMNVEGTFIAVEEIKYPLKEEKIPLEEENFLPCEDALSVKEETLIACGENISQTEHELEKERKSLEQKFSLENEKILCEDKNLSNKEEHSISRENIYVMDDSITVQISLLDNPSPPLDEELLQHDSAFISLIEEPICLINVKEEDDNPKGELNFTKVECHLQLRFFTYSFLL